jgi:DNA ligase-1
MRYWKNAMLRLSQLCDSVAATSKKTEKVRLVTGYLRSSSTEEAALGALYLCGRVFPRREERVLSIGFALLLRAVAGVAERDPRELAPILQRHGDLGAGAEEVLHPRSTTTASLSLIEMAAAFDSLARQRGPAAKQALLESTLRRLSSLEAKYFIKIATGELRIGLKESLVEEAIAVAYEQSLAAVQRANMLTGDISETLRLTAAGRLASVTLQIFRPFSVMLASPSETPEEVIAAFPSGALAEEKFDGIRAQVHKQGAQVEIYSRTLDRVTEFPELIGPLRSLPGDFILDGEIIGWRDARAIPFTELQQRLGLLRPSPTATKAFSRKPRSRRTFPAAAANSGSSSSARWRPSMSWSRSRSTATASAEAYCPTIRSRCVTRAAT